jgi:hypothetical protein
MAMSIIPGLTGDESGAKNSRVDGWVDGWVGLIQSGQFVFLRQNN